MTSNEYDLIVIGAGGAKENAPENISSFTVKMVEAVR